MPQQQHLQMCTNILLLLLLLLISNSSTTNAAITAQTSSTSYPTMVNQFLALQNAARKALGKRPLVWDEKVARYARWYANQRRLDCALKHSDGPYGENIFWGSGNGWTPAEAAASWISERKWYDYWSNSCRGGQQCGHYTQAVWSNTRRIGCARVICYGNRGVFMTCNYDPPGNFVGQRPY